MLLFDIRADDRLVFPLMKKTMFDSVLKPKPPVVIDGVPTELQRSKLFPVLSVLDLHVSRGRLTSSVLCGQRR